jgi:hypothetical protein
MALLVGFLDKDNVDGGLKENVELLDIVVMTLDLVLSKIDN